MTCPTCKQATTWEGNRWRPFCSERCQIMDLGAWAAERYRVPGASLTVKRGHPESQRGDEPD
jgi:uncharacterized protein